jgi:hypothetical protein
MGLRSFGCTPDSKTVFSGFLLIPWNMGQSHGRTVPSAFKGSSFHLFRVARGIASGMSISFYYRDVVVQKVRTVVSDSLQRLLLEFGQGRVAHVAQHDAITHLSHP